MLNGDVTADKPQLKRERGRQAGQHQSRVLFIDKGRFHSVAPEPLSPSLSKNKFKLEAELLSPRGLEGRAAGTGEPSFSFPFCIVGGEATAPIYSGGLGKREDSRLPLPTVLSLPQWFCSSKFFVHTSIMGHLKNNFLKNVDIK